MRLSHTLPLAAALTGLFMGGCAAAEKKSALPSTTPTTAAPAKAAPATAPGSGGSVSLNTPNAPNTPIYFAHDSDQLTEDSQKELQQMAAFMLATPGAKLTIEGHCDDTGSSEYNLALGDRRARMATEYLRKLGVDETRLNRISYGEERPAVAGTDDAARAKNRRGVFDLKS